MIHAACLVGGGWALCSWPAWLFLALRWARAEMGCACNPGVPATTLPLVTEVPEPRRLLATLCALQVSFLSSVVQTPAPASQRAFPPHQGLRTAERSAAPGAVSGQVLLLLLVYLRDRCIFCAGLWQPSRQTPDPCLSFHCSCAQEGMWLLGVPWPSVPEPTWASCSGLAPVRHWSRGQGGRSPPGGPSVVRPGMGARV